MLFSPSNFFKSTVNLTVNPLVVFVGAVNAACGACAVSVLSAGCVVSNSQSTVSSAIIRLSPLVLVYSTVDSPICNLFCMSSREMPLVSGTIVCTQISCSTIMQQKNRNT